MADNSNPDVDVNIDTTDLDAFESDFYGKTAKVAEPVVEEDPADVDPGATEDDDTTDAVETDEDESLEDGDDEVAEEAPKPKKKTVQERINELTREKREAERREADAIRRLDEALAARASKTEDQPKPVIQSAALDADAPQPDAVQEDGETPVYPLGEFDPLFIRDLTKFVIAKETAAARAQQEQEAAAKAQQEAATKLQTEWETKLSTAEKDIQDLRPTIASLQDTLVDLDPNFGTYLAQTIMGMEVGPQVLYYLAKNVDEAKKIAASNPVAATLALGRLEAKLQTPKEDKAAQPARVSKAPTPPITTRGVGASNAVADDTDDLDAFTAKFFKKK